MDVKPVKYAILRDRASWDVKRLRGLIAGNGGILTLKKVPGPIDGSPIVMPGPYEVAMSGIAVDESNFIYLSDADVNQVIRVDLRCNTRLVLPNESCESHTPPIVNAPQGLAPGPGRKLIVADSGNGRIMSLHADTLEPIDLWEDFEKPAAIAFDGQKRIYVLDRGYERVLRYCRRNAIDAEFYSTITASKMLKSPCSFALEQDGTLFVSDDKLNIIVRFNDKGSPLLPPLPNDERITVAKPRALAAGNGLLFVADAQSGRIFVFDCAANVWLCALTGYQGPVSAMAVDRDGGLFVKHGPGPEFSYLAPEQEFVDCGELIAGPFDAGIGCEWERVAVEAETPSGAQVTLHTCASPVEMPDIPTTWNDTAALDILLRPYGRSDDSKLPLRFLWICIEVTGNSTSATPKIFQVQAQTTTKSYLDHLPAVYRRDDTSGFLESWLALFRSRLSDFESTIEDSARRFDPMLGEREHLKWLAKKLDFAPPGRQSEAEGRSTLKRLQSLYAKRGTIEGLADFVELYTGIRPVIREAFRDRHIWQLGYSYLDCDTGLASALPDGTIVPAVAQIDRTFQGLLREVMFYHSYPSGNPMITRFFSSQIDPALDFGPKSSLLFQNETSADRFLVRWSGQVRPKYAETYAFHLNSNQVARLWIDGRKWIDNREDILKKTDSKVLEKRVRILMEDDHWYPIVVEVERIRDYDPETQTTLSLSWSSLSQKIPQMIPSERFFALNDDLATVGEISSPDALVVGESVVGESGPLQSAQFGEPLYDHTAHLFIVLVIGAHVKDAPSRAHLQRIIEMEKPAHTDYALCYIEPEMRVGYQCRVGVDTIVAGPLPPMDLGNSVLGLESSYVANNGQEGPYIRIGKSDNLGITTLLV